MEKKTADVKRKESSAMMTARTEEDSEFYTIGSRSIAVPSRFGGDGNKHQISSCTAMTTPLEEETDNASSCHHIHYNGVYHNLQLLRYQSEVRQLGGVILTLGIGATFSSFALIAILVEGKTGMTQVDGFRLPALVGTFIQTFLGMAAMGTGFVCVLYTPIYNRIFHIWAKWFVLIVNLGPIAFVITIMRLIDGAKEPPEDNDFIPPMYGPTQQDINFVVAMGCLVLMSVCSTIVGGLTVTGLQLCAYQGYQPHSRNRQYHIIRYGYYNLQVFIGGASHLALGLYCWSRFGFGPYGRSVHVAAYTVYFPMVSALVGFFQSIMGLYGFLRAIGKCPIGGPNDHSFMVVAFVAWVMTTFLQCLFQPSYGVGDVHDAEGATVAAVYLGFFVMPTYLDYLVRHTPNVVKSEDYGLQPNAYYKEDILVKLFYGSAATTVTKQQGNCDKNNNDNHNDAKDIVKETGCHCGEDDLEVAKASSLSPPHHYEHAPPILQATGGNNSSSVDYNNDTLYDNDDSEATGIMRDIGARRSGDDDIHCHF